jgi:hypothetical protein
MKGHRTYDDTADDPAWAAIDSQILARNRLAAVQAIRRAFGCPLGDAVSLLGLRYRHLRNTVPDAFGSTDEDYWKASTPDQAEHEGVGRPMTDVANAKARLLAALDTPQPFDALREVALELRTGGMSRDEMYALFEGIRSLASAASHGDREDAVLDAMDLIVGYCPPDIAIFPPDDSLESGSA